MQKPTRSSFFNLFLACFIALVLCSSALFLPLSMESNINIGDNSTKNIQPSSLQNHNGNNNELGNLGSRSSEGAENVIKVKYIFSKPEIQVGNEYDRITITGLTNHYSPGKPKIPFETARILLPPGRSTESIDIDIITGGNIKINGEYTIEHSNSPAPLCIGEENDPELLELPDVEMTKRDEELYNSKTPYPGKLFEYVTTQTCRGYNILILNLYPVRYTPNPGEIEYYRSMEVQVGFREIGALSTPSMDSPDMFRGLKKDTDHVTGLVDNPKLVSKYNDDSNPKCTSIQQISSSLVNSSLSYDYVIITNESLKNSNASYNFQDLIDSKINRGLKATIETVENITAESAYWNLTNSKFNDTQALIRNFIIDGYLNWGIEYVLLGGDGDGQIKGSTTETNDQVIPARGLKGWYENNIPSDLYYSGLDGNWNNDTDNLWGEFPQEADLFAEVYVGRAPIDSDTELSNFVRKTLAYENTSLSDPVLREVLMVGEHLWGPPTYPVTLGGDYMDEIKDGSSAHGYTTVGIPQNYTVKTLYDRDYTAHRWPKSKIKSIMNSNVHIINHLGHSNVNYNMRMGNSDADSLTNSNYFLGFSQGCYCGSFDNRGTSATSYLNYDCIVEHFVTESSGAFAFIANSRYGYGEAGSTDGASQYFDRELFDAFFGENIYNIGKANQDAKEDNIGVLSVHPVMVYCCYELNLLGDPEVSLKVPDPPEHDIEVKDLSAPAQLELTTTGVIGATIRNRGGNIENSVVINFTLDGITNISKTITNLQRLTEQYVVFNWTPTLKGTYNVGISAAIVATEETLVNNEQIASIEVLPMAKISVSPTSFKLSAPQDRVVNKRFTISNTGLANLTFQIAKLNVAIEYCGRMNTPITQLKSMIESYGYGVDIVKGTDIDTISELQNYDVVILGSSGYGPDDDFSTFENTLESWVRNCSGGVVGVGSIDWAVDETSAMGKLMPVDTGPAHGWPGTDNDYHNGGKISILVNHEITQNVSDIIVPTGRKWYSPTHGLNTGATKLGKSSTFNPAIACWDYGSGRSVYFAGGLMLDRTWYGSDWWYTEDNVSRLLNNAIGWAGKLKDSSWLSTNITNGSTGINKNSAVDIIINTTNLSVLDHNHTLTVLNNDPEPHFIRITVNLTVLGDVKKIHLSPNTWSGTADEECTFTVTGYDIRDNQVEFEKQWSTTDRLGAVIDGVYQPGRVGQWRVYCNNSDDSVSAYAEVFVSHGVLDHIEVYESAWTGTTDEKITLYGYGYDADNNMVQFTKHWSTTDPGGAVINGVYIPNSPGNWRVYCNNSDNSVSGYCDVYISHGKLARISISLDPTFMVCSADDEITIEATGYDAKNNPVGFIKVWSTTDPWGSISSIYQPGKVGTWKIYCNNSDNSVSAHVTLVVNPGALDSIEVTPADAVVSADQTLEFEAIGYDSDGNAFDINPTWEVVSTKTGTGGTIDHEGSFDPVKVGKWKINAIVDDLVGHTQVTVQPGEPDHIVISPSEVRVTADDQIIFETDICDSDGNTVTIKNFNLDSELFWECTDGIIDSRGYFTPHQVGTVEIFATIPKYNIEGTATVEVTVGKLNYIKVTTVERDRFGGDDDIDIGIFTIDEIPADITQQFYAYGYDGNHNFIDLSTSQSQYMLDLEWTVENGVISSNGLFYPEKTGAWLVSASVGAVSGSTSVNVVPGPLVKIAIIPSTADLQIGESIDLKTCGYDIKNNNCTIPGEEQNIQWEISDENIGTIDSNGTFIAIAYGTVIVTMTIDDLNARAVIMVAPADHDNDSVPDHLDPDDDNDGIPDTWEIRYGLDPLNSSDSDLDPDNDGLTNLEEYNKDTDPFDHDTDSDGHFDLDDDYPLDPARWDSSGSQKTVENANSSWLWVLAVMVVVVLVLLLVFGFYRKFIKRSFLSQQ